MINGMTVECSFRDGERTARRGQESLDVGDVVSAREAFLRAADYFRLAESFCRDDPSQDLEALSLSRCARNYFWRAAKMTNGKFAAVSIPYEGGALPGYLLLVDDSGKPRPTVIYTHGLGSTCEEGYSVIGAAALRRGYNFLAYDGPGQGAMIREKNVPMRPDWEKVLGPVVDYALTVPEVREIVHFGHGLGGYLVARHAARDHRSTAIVCNDGMTTFYASYPPIPEPILELIEDGHDDEAVPMLDVLATEDTGARRGLRTGQWVLGETNPVEYVRKTADYTLTANDIRQITTPVLVLESADDALFAGQAANFARAMTAPVHHVVKRNADGAMHQTVFNYLATLLR
jgi:pimeloyl-ACP methyl ester carboxylesterase